MNEQASTEKQNKWCFIYQSRSKVEMEIDLDLKIYSVYWNQLTNG